MRIKAGASNTEGSTADGIAPPEGGVEGHLKYGDLWTQARKDELIRLWYEGVRGKDIAETFGCTDNQVFVMARRMNLPRRALLMSGQIARVLEAGAQAGPRPKRDEPAMRSCLSCGDFFPSEHAGNRMCHNCLSHS